MGIPDATIAILRILTEIAKIIGPTILQKFKTDFILENKQTFQKNVISYHDKVRKILYDDEGSPKRLANDIAQDRIFCYYATDENSKQIIDALIYVDGLPKSRKGERKKILEKLLKVFEHSRV